jgi:hypothetical protein
MDDDTVKFQREVSNATEHINGLIGHYLPQKARKSGNWKILPRTGPLRVVISTPVDLKARAKAKIKTYLRENVAGDYEVEFLVFEYTA